MAFTSFPLQSQFAGYDDHGNPLYDRAITSKDLQYIYKMWFSNGVWFSPLDNLQVSAVGGMQVKIKAGRIHIEGVISFTYDDIILDVPAAGVIKRLDAVVLQLDRETNRITAAYILPDGASSVSKLTRNSNIYEMALAEITVLPSASTIFDTNIRDLRSYGTEPENWCGMSTMRVPDPNFGAFITNLTAQAVAIMNAWEAQMGLQQTNWLAQMAAQAATFGQSITEWRAFFAGAQSSLPTYAGFDFDNQFLYPGTKHDTAFNANGSITETLKLTADDSNIAKLDTVFNADGSITETETVYAADYVTVLWKRKKTTVFNIDGSIKEEVINV